MGPPFALLLSLLSVSPFYHRPAPGASRTKGAGPFAPGLSINKKSLFIKEKRAIVNRQVRPGAGSCRRTDLNTIIHTLSSYWKKLWVRILLALVLVLGAALVFLFVINRFYLEIHVHGDQEVRVEYESSYTDAGADALFTGTIVKFFEKEPEVTAEGEVDTNTLGTYKIRYTSSIYGMTSTAYRTVIVEDTVPPVLTLLTVPDHYTLPHHPYEEEGFTAEDNHDGDISARVVSREQDGVVYYTVRDMSGNEATAERTIFYDDRTPPVITLKGPSRVVMNPGETWSDAYSAEDDAEGDVTDRVTVSGKVESSVPGDYTLTYSCTDDYDNTGTAERTVTVRKPAVARLPVEKKAEEDKKDSKDKKEEPAWADVTAPFDPDKVIYLTFDDGPGPYTDELLSILDKYNVKATFFVTGMYPGSAGCIAREAKAGHSVAVHTWSHDYASIYQSADAYWKDFEKARDLIRDQTGKETTLFRFPGGSSNTISQEYCQGVMTELTDQAKKKGYTWFDWNVDCNDAGGTLSASGVFDNFRKGVAGQTKAVVLCHDVKSYTVKAMDQVIPWALKNGYTFLPLTPYSETAHHGVNN